MPFTLCNGHCVERKKERTMKANREKIKETHIHLQNGMKKRDKPAPHQLQGDPGCYKQHDFREANEFPR